MNDDFLKRRLQRVARRFHWIALGRKLSACWAVAALLTVGIIYLQRALGANWTLALPTLVALAGGAAAVLVLRHFTRQPDPRWVAQKIEKQFPELNGVLLTAVQQQADPKAEPGYLQYRLIQEATARSQQQDWRRVVPSFRFAVGAAIQVFALGLFVYALSHLKVATIHGEAPAWVGKDGVAVTPGDTSVEKGDSLVILARFGGALPANVNLVIRESGAAPRAQPLVKSLADPVFGGSIAEVARDFVYHLEYRGERTKEFKVAVYEHPKLVRSDVTLVFPDYTQLPPKRIEDTRRVSAVEGTKLDFALQLNKPVKSAKLVARNSEKTEIPLAVKPGEAVASLAAFSPAKTATYDLQLVDAEGRANKAPTPFVIDVQPNRRPEIRLISPRGDVRPSPLEEVAFDGTVWDDFGVPTYGLAYSISGGETKSVELGRSVAAKEKRSFAHLLGLEDLGTKADDLVSWYAWAEDIGPDGKVRRTNGDMYFGEVRPFDEIFRESQNMESGEEQGQQQGGGQQTRRLTELQKQIISATWKLQRDGKTPKYADDVEVVSGSQAQALAQANEAAEEARSPREQAMWRSAINEMEKALAHLKSADSDPAPLAQALPAEQAAYQALLKLNARETAITRGQRKGGGGGQQGNQRQIDQLDLQQSENRYETQRQAKAPQNQERREQLAVTNRLQELARRQQDLNERMKELQTSLQESKTEQEREEIKRRLKRLQEEQQQMLADVDEVRQRMDRPENQSRMAEERQQLEQTRDAVQQAAQAAADGSVAQALASGTRAQRQLQELRDNLRKENSSQFAEDLREMRSEARDIARQQEEVSRKIDQLANAANQPRRTLGESGERKELLDKLTEQKERMNRVVDRATQVSEQAENSEPLLSRQLYDSIRKATQDDASAVKQTRQDLVNRGLMTRSLDDRLEKTAEREGGGKALDLTGEMLKEGLLPQARQAGQSARNGIDELRRGVERAADSVLGDDAEQLKLARAELDALTDQLQREIAQAGGDPAADPNGQPGKAGQPGQNGRRGAADSRQAQAGREPGEPGGNEPGAGQPGAEGQGAGEAQENQPGQTPGQRADRQRRTADARDANRRGQPGGREPGQTGEPGEQPGQQPGQGQTPGEQPGQGQGQGEGQGQGQGQGQQPGEQPGQGGQGGQMGQGGQQPGQTPGRGQRGGRASLADGRGGPGERNANGEGRGGLELDNLLRPEGQAGGVGGGGWDRVRNGLVLTGEDFARWNERLRDVEDLIEDPQLRNEVAVARERARQLRREVRDQKKPDWAVVNLQVLKPLVEVRSRVAEELARRDSKDSLAPIDRDPVPNRFADSVRRYYEELGKDTPAPR